MSDRQAALRSRLECGAVTIEHLRVAAWLGDEDAAAVASKRWRGGQVEDYSWPARHALAFAKIRRKERALASALIAVRVLDVVEEFRPDDDAPRRAIEATLAYVSSPCRKTAAAAKLAAKAAWDLSNELFAGVVEERNDKAGWSTTAAARAADVAAGDDCSHPADEENSAYEASLACGSAEHEPQRLVLISVLCGDELGMILPPREALVLDRTQVLRHRIRSRIVSTERLQVAASLGDAAALSLVKKPWRDPATWNGLPHEARRLMIAALCGDHVTEPVQVVIVGEDQHEK